MQLTEAYARLRERWPGRSFCIALEVWHHRKGFGSPGSSEPSIEWFIWDHRAGTMHREPTLESAVTQALRGDGDLAMVSRQIADIVGRGEQS